MRLSSAGLLCALIIITTGCRSESDSTGPTVVELDAPGMPGSSRPALSRGASGRLLLSWVEPVDSVQTRIAYSSFDGSVWSDSKTVVLSDDLFTNWADVQQLLPMEKDAMLATWGVSSGSSYLATHLMAGETQPGDARIRGRLVHTDTSATQHGFASLTHTTEGPMIVWLDGRETTLDEGVVDESEWGEMALYAGFPGSDGIVRDETLLDNRVCDCCPTSVVATDSGALIAYRDRSDDEQRDIHLIRYEEGTFTEPVSLHADGWIIRGCPVNGPALDADGNRVAVAWFTAADDRPVVKAAFSSDGGRTFSEPVTVDADRPHGRVGTVLLSDGSAAVSWTGRDERMSAIKVARVSEAGVGSTTVVARPQSPAFTGIPAISRIDDAVIVVWTDGSHPDSTRIRASRLEM